MVVGVADEVGSGPMAWTTTDGTVWERQAVFDPATGPGLRSVAQIGDLLVAVGPGDSSTAVWTSTDGRAWTRAYYVSVDNSTVVTKDFEGAMAAVAARPSQFVAVGLTVGGLTSDFGGAAWTSADGHAWSPAPASVSLRRAPLLDVTVGGPGFVAVGGIDGAVAMTSSDGVSWLLHDLVDRLGNLQLRAVAAGSNGRLVTVGSVAGAGAVATSDDGVSWSLVPCQPVLQGASLETVVAIPDGFVAAGSRNLGERSVMSIWTSSDGVTWSIVDIPDPAAGQPLGIGLTPLGLVAAGNGGVWVGPSNGAGSHELRTGGHCSDAPDGTEGGAGEEPVPGDPAEEPGVEPAIPPDEPAEP
ncbi:MAG TPA: hypothetical protein VFR14_05855 [Candidatus Limnocylindrales bacterium]|nr:hypothetical protein [Candidatus Limnocylindrales bacterium]